MHIEIAILIIVPQWSKILGFFPDFAEKNGEMERWSDGVLIAPILHHSNNPLILNHGQSKHRQHNGLSWCISV